MNKFEFSHRCRIQLVLPVCNMNPGFGDPSSAVCVVGGFQLETELLVQWFRSISRLFCFKTIILALGA